MKKFIIFMFIISGLCSCMNSENLSVVGLGKTTSYPNAVVLNASGINLFLDAEWYQDGVSMGQMRRINRNCYIAVPSQYAEHATVVVKGIFGRQSTFEVDLTDYVDVQAHRGGAGLMPENTLEAMIAAVDLGVNTLELDLVLSEDGKVVVSHDLYFHSRYSIRPDGSLVMKEEPREWLYNMSYEDIRKYDVGSRVTDVWPDKACFPAVKPLAGELIDSVESYTRKHSLSPMRYNIEVKSKAGSGEGVEWPDYKVLSDACLEVLLGKQLGDRLVVQCFDPRALNYMHSKYPEVKYSYLVGEEAADLDAALAILDFTPAWLSPHHSLTDEALVKMCHEKGMRIVPWTVDKVEDIEKMLSLGVDAIISNYPDRVLSTGK